METSMAAHTCNPRTPGRLGRRTASSSHLRNLARLRLKIRGRLGMESSVKTLGSVEGEGAARERSDYKSVLRKALHEMSISFLRNG